LTITQLVLLPVTRKHLVLAVIQAIDDYEEQTRRRCSTETTLCAVAKHLRRIRNTPLTAAFRQQDASHR